ncbi:MAG: hypothetical protein ACYTEU_11270 [Planctomycetota bacterium]
MGRAKVFIERAVFGGAGITLKENHRDESGVQRLVHLVEQVFVGKVHFF